MEISKNNRDITIDIVKAIAIILVVLGHSIQYACGEDYLKSLAFYDNWLYKIIYSFHMPLFMCVSGWLFGYSIQRYDISKLLKRKVIALIFPLVSWGTIHYLLTKMFLGHQTFDLSVWWMIVGGGL